MNWDTIEETARLALAPLGLRIRSNRSKHVPLFVYAVLETGPDDEPIIVGIQCIADNVSGPEAPRDQYRVRVDACREDSGEMNIDDIPSVTVMEGSLLVTVQEQGTKLVERAKALLS